MWFGGGGRDRGGGRSGNIGDVGWCTVREGGGESRVIICGSLAYILWVRHQSRSRMVSEHAL